MFSFLKKKIISGSVSSFYILYVFFAETIYMRKIKMKKQNKQNY